MARAEDALRTYKIKTDCNPEPYVMKHMARKKRAVYAQFRIGVVPLRIEAGRITNVPP